MKTKRILFEEFGDFGNRCTFSLLDGIYYEGYPFEFLDDAFTFFIGKPLAPDEPIVIKYDSINFDTLCFYSDDERKWKSAKWNEDSSQWEITDVKMTSKKIFDISCIIEISKTGLTYSNHNGDRCFIDFYNCRRNWVNYVNESKKFITWEGEPFRNISESGTNCIGQRDWFSEKPYFEFFDNPIVRFEIRPQKRFWEVFNKRWIKCTL